MSIKMRRFCSQEFKQEAVQASFESPDSVAAVAAKLEFHPELLSRWKRQMARRKDDKEPDFHKFGDTSSQ
ncbi:MAG: transposase [Wenzhouxiangellaceae bacterium]|nr:transposase [Wenzhouxiangellaceae bacterium]